MPNFHVDLPQILRRAVCASAWFVLAAPIVTTAFAAPVAPTTTATSQDGAALIQAPASTQFTPLPPAAAAASAADAVSQFLVEKGFISAVSAQTSAPGVPESGFVARVRDKASNMVLTAMNFLGVPYRRGGNTVDSGFDCSGFTRQVFESSLGFALPRRADEQAHAAGLVAVKRDDLQPGDLVFFNTLRRTFSHVGIYLGDGKFIHSPKPGGEVRVEDMRFVYWAKRFTGARRAEPMVDTNVDIRQASAEPEIAATPPVSTPAHRSQRKHAQPHR